jgi:hypothetical protein
MSLKQESVDAPLHNARDRFFLDENENTEVDIELQYKGVPGRITDVNLCAVLFDYEGNLYDCTFTPRSEKKTIFFSDVKTPAKTFAARARCSLN